MTPAEVYLEGARKIADGETVSVVWATGDIGNPYVGKLLEYFGYGCAFPWEVEEIPEDEARELRVLTLLFMAEIVAYDKPSIH